MPQTPREGFQAQPGRSPEANPGRKGEVWEGIGILEELGDGSGGLDVSASAPGWADVSGWMDNVFGVFWSLWNSYPVTMFKQMFAVLPLLTTQVLCYWWSTQNDTVIDQQIFSIQSMKKKASFHWKTVWFIFSLCCDPHMTPVLITDEWGMSQWTKSFRTTLYWWTVQIQQHSNISAHYWLRHKNLANDFPSGYYQSVIILFMS